MFDPLLEQLLVGFVDESQEIYDRISQDVIEMEKSPAPQRFDDLARGLHTLKGSAATLGLEELADLAHKMEDVVLPLRGQNAPLPPATVDALLRTLDVWMARLRATANKVELPDLAPSVALLAAAVGAPAKVPAPAAVPAAGSHPGAETVTNGHAASPASAAPAPATLKEGGGASPTSPPAATSAGTQPAAGPAPLEDPGAQVQSDEGSWRVSTRQVVALLHEVERLREVRLRVEERRREVDRCLAQLDRLGILSETAETRAQLLGVRRSLAADGEEASDIVASMEDGLKAICTLPVRTVLEPLRRAVRDLCKMSGKAAKLSVVGAEVSLDRRVLEAIRSPLVHLVRNAVDHGLEMPDVREARGKHREGALVVRVEQQGNMLFIEVADDGDGLDVARIKEVALARGVANAQELAAMTVAQAHQLVFRPGFSTKAVVTEVSGRGVGLDIVRAQIQAMQGQVEVQSVPGQGTRFILTLPAELGSSPVLVVRCGEHQIGLPMVAVESSRSSKSSDLRIGRTKLQLHHRDQLIPLQDLGALMGLRQPEAPTDGQPLLILQSQGRRLALSVDEVIGDKELVIRPLPIEVRELPAYQGAATLARGELVLIVRADWVVDIDRRSDRQLGTTRRVLVVDDSLTARALHRTALEAGGYMVHTASSGRQALEQLRHSAYDVMVTDIGMDDMDGYELTSEVRQRSETDAMPVILVSARDSESDKQRGIAVGADGFLSKKDCVAGRLLAEISAVIARRKGLS